MKYEIFRNSTKEVIHVVEGFWEDVEKIVAGLNRQGEGVSARKAKGTPSAPAKPNAPKLTEEPVKLPADKEVEERKDFDRFTIDHYPDDPLHLLCGHKGSVVELLGVSTNPNQEAANGELRQLARQIAGV